MNQAIYNKALKNGCTSRFAEMLACRQGPCLRTDDTYFRGFGNVADEVGEDRAKDLAKKLAKKGRTLGAGDVYLSQVAQEDSDPRAVFSRSEGTGAIKKRIEEIGCGCEGRWTIPTRGPESDPLADENCVPIGEDLIQSRMRAEVRENPESAKELSKLRKAVVHKHGPAKGKKRTDFMEGQ